MNLDQSRCAYYAEADGVLPKDDDEPATASNPKLRREVDDLVFELVDKGTDFIFMYVCLFAIISRLARQIMMRFNKNSNILTEFVNVLLFLVSS